MKWRFIPTGYRLLLAFMIFLVLPFAAHVTVKIEGLCPLDRPIKIEPLPDCERINGECFCHEWLFVDFSGYTIIRDLVFPPQESADSI